MIGDESSACFIWSREEDYIFEHGLATYPEDLEDRWERIAANIPGKSVEDIKQHYEILLDDVNRIESGCVPFPCYESFQDGFTDQVGHKGTGKKGGSLGQFGANGSKASRADQERRKGTAWSTEEHKLFLLGLEKYGKGDWRSISRNYVVTRTPTQVASHAQKYFIRLKSANKDRRRPSIYDVTNGNNNDVSVPQGPIPGHVDGSFGKPSKQLSPSPEALSGVGPYVGTESPLGIGLHGGTVIGQPVGGHLISTTGTPATLPQPTHMVNLPQPAHMAYGVRPPISGQMVMAAPVNMGPMTYSVPSSYS